MVVGGGGAGQGEARGRDDLPGPDIGRGVVPPGGGKVEGDGVADDLAKQEGLGDVEAGRSRAVIGLVARQDPGHPDDGLFDGPCA